ncbi:MAG: ABC transporter ATP-binding protein [Acidobacteria bacterium]|nr:ABC transporter ATP-binding protein [Acidobacteriota bacterium]
MIRLHEACKSFGAVQAVSGLSFSVNPGQITAFLGPNGSGKTTTMRMITGFLDADRGQVEVHGDAGPVSGLDRNRITGYLPENTPLYPDMPVIDFLRFVAKARGVGDVKSRIRHVVKACALHTHLDRTIAQLSKGFKQRVGLAQALIHDPAILVLDEPTTGLDPIQVHELLNMIRDLGRDKTILLSTHILQHMDRICDKVVVINQGKLRFEGSPAAFGAYDPRRLLITLQTPAHRSDLPDALDLTPIGSDNSHQWEVVTELNAEQLTAKFQATGAAVEQVVPLPPSFDRAFRHLIEGAT